MFLLFVRYLHGGQEDMYFRHEVHAFFRHEDMKHMFFIQLPVFLSSCQKTRLHVFLSKQHVFLSRDGKKLEESVRFLLKSLAVKRIFPTFVVAMRQSR